jgi:hypothetical protein
LAAADPFPFWSVQVDAGAAQRRMQANAAPDINRVPADAGLFFDSTAG